MIRILKYGQVPNSEVFARVSPTVNVEAIVTDIIANVRKNGDKAVLEYNLKFDKAKMDSLLVSQSEIAEAFASVDPEFISILEEAAENIRNFHSRQVRNSFVIADKPGIVLGQKVTPIEKVGVYVPGGTAAYPSTVLMDTIPAKIAGCPYIAMVTPPNAEGKINPVILAAAKIAGVTVWMPSSKWAAPRLWQPWLTVRKVSPKWIRLWAPAMLLWRRPRSRSSDWYPLT